VCGTPNYIAPEILDGKTGHSYEVDIWSLGVIIYTLIIGKPPFETQDVKTTYKRIKMNSYTFPERAVISDAAKSLITEILNTDPLKRPSLDGILASDFFNLGVSIPKLLPTSTLACPPSLSYIRQFMPEAGSNGIVQKPLSSTQRFSGVTGSVEIKDNSVNQNNKIFVSIASYRDPQCSITLIDLIKKAEFPQNLVIVICQQNDIDDEDPVLQDPQLMLDWINENLTWEQLSPYAEYVKTDRQESTRNKNFVKATKKVVEWERQLSIFDFISKGDMILSNEDDDDDEED
jgi:serine/threonine protein kinase